MRRNFRIDVDHPDVVDALIRAWQKQPNDGRKHPDCIDPETGERSTRGDVLKMVLTKRVVGGSPVLIEGTDIVFTVEFSD